MKVGIVTITELDNFGNRLQNYALQETLKSLGVEVETINNYENHYRYLSGKKMVIKELYEDMKTQNWYRLSYLLKQVKFNKFNNKYIRFSKYYQKDNIVSPNLSESYEYFIAGSDQIWNPYFNFNHSFNFLQFCKKEKRVAYAASFGIENIPDDKEKIFAKYITEMSKISVREYAGQEIIKSLCGKAVPVLLDPTFLLNKKSWIKMQKRPFWLSKKCNYILKYFLGKEKEEILPDELKKQYEIINITDFNKIMHYAIDPLEFIWLINHAQLVVTDSFHGIVFSIIMGAPFICSQRFCDDDAKSMNSRIESLFRKLEYKYTNGINDFHITHAENICNKIEMCKNESIEYLSKSLFDVE